MVMSGNINSITDRRISKETCRKYYVTSDYGRGGEVAHHWYPYYNTKTGDLTATKKRTCDTKSFSWSGDRTDIGLFGQQTCRGKGKFLTITEGELDALAVSEMFDNKWDVVSLRDGAGNAARDIKSQLEWLEGYDTVVLVFDKDKAGQEAVEAVRDLFSPDTLKVVTLPDGFKDPNAMLMAGEVKKFVSAWWDAKVYRPDGIIAGNETWDLLVANRNTKSVPYPWEGLNEITRGHRLGELVTVTSGSGMGKSQFIRELEFDLLNRVDANIGVLALEEDVSRTALGIMSVAANRPLHLEEETPDSELRPYWEATMGTGRYYLFDHWGSTSADNLLSRVRYMAKALDCRYVVLDHLSIVVSSQESGDERKAIDEIMTRLRTLVAETGICLFLVSHLKRSGGTAHEDGGRISLSELRGSQSIAQLSDMVIGMERDQQHEDPEVRNTTCVRVLKNRYTGETGPACYLYYDRVTGRLTETSAPATGETEMEF
jgi:twinkle protein